MKQTAEVIVDHYDSLTQGLPVCWCTRDFARLCRCTKDPNVPHVNPDVSPISTLSRDMRALVCHHVLRNQTWVSLMGLFRVNTVFHATTCEIIHKAILELGEGFAGFANQILASFLDTTHTPSSEDFEKQFLEWDIFGKCQRAWNMGRFVSFSVCLSTATYERVQSRWTPPKAKKFTFTKPWPFLKHFYAPRHEGNANPILECEDLAKRVISLHKIQKDLTQLDEKVEVAQEIVDEAKSALRLAELNYREASVKYDQMVSRKRTFTHAWPVDRYPFERILKKEKSKDDDDDDDEDDE